MEGVGGDKGRGNCSVVILLLRFIFHYHFSYLVLIRILHAVINPVMVDLFILMLVHIYLKVATGDGIAMSHRAQAVISNME